MAHAPHWLFDPFRLDAENALLWRGTEPLELKPKTFAVLLYLVQHAGRLVTKDALLDAVWPRVAVSDAVLKVCIADLRKVLGDAAQAPRFIATVHRRGYRFIAPVTQGAPPPVPEDMPPADLPAADEAGRSLPQVHWLPHTPLPLVERETALHQLYAAWAQARQGVRQVVFLTGEAGIGKTSVVQTFTAAIAQDPGVWLASGQCVEHYGPGEAYLPVLDAVGQLCRAPGGARLITLLRQQAPTWLVQMPWLLTETDRELLQQELHGTTRERMLRELAEVLETLTAETPLVLVFEDLHWSDYATLDVLAWVARRQGAARLLLLGTYRPVDAIVHGHPLRTVTQELRRHGYSTELPLRLLSAEAVTAYVATRCPGLQEAAVLGKWVHQRTDGNPLFMVHVVEHMMARGVLAAADGQWTLRGGLEALEEEVPESSRQMLAQQFERLSREEQQVLEAASVEGVEFSAAAVAAGLAVDVVEAEGQCEGLARQQHWLRPIGTDAWPDRTMAGRYAFLHALYHHVVYQRLAPARRVHLHWQLGIRKEAAYGPRAGEIAAELALHFEHGRDYPRVVQYLRLAAETASQRHAHREAIAYLKRGLELLKTMPETQQSPRQELAFQLALGPALMVARGFAAPEVVDTYTRARQLCEQLGDRQQLFPVLFGLWRSAHVRGQLQTARALGEQLLSLANAQADPILFVEAGGPLGQTLCMQGEPMLAREHLQQVVALYEPHQHRTLVVRCGYDPGVYAHMMEAWVLWVLGYPAQGLRRSHEALTLARGQADPFTLVLTLVTLVILQHMRREGEPTREHVQVSLDLSTAHGFPYLTAISTILQGWELANAGQVAAGITQMREELAAFRAMGAEILRPSLLMLLADACARHGQIEAGLGALEEALVTADTHTERFYAAELHRLQGELLLRQGTEAGAQAAARAMHAGQAAAAVAMARPSPQAQAEACFQNALDIARHQGARLLELRAAISLSRLWCQHDKRREARQLLADIYGWFTEGFETADLQEARTLLDELR